ncbi:hypothetical protein [Virgisporangium aurantiacum]|uniref:Uncharacterized protein n=1 Tax=Virgisporangium aurantiacum TaxID=175570 RepID=A0A8J3Z0J8_9ACTN|nr:hypothetical protein [Virgisporangium aurantiacum]GIJ54082.1 hypothetical protein Vau01_015980 [Virgisporangium aurantiacum]
MTGLVGSLLVVDGGEDDGRVSGRAVLVELSTAVSAAALRDLTNVGRFTGCGGAKQNDLRTDDRRVETT